jgi:hypothetical protein
MRRSSSSDRTSRPLSAAARLCAALFALAACGAPEANAPAELGFRLELTLDPGFSLLPREQLTVLGDGRVRFEQGDETTTWRIELGALAEIQAGVRAFSDMDRVTTECPRVVDTGTTRVRVVWDGNQSGYDRMGICSGVRVGCAARAFEFLVVRRSGAPTRHPLLPPVPELCGQPD